MRGRLSLGAMNKWVIVRLVVVAAGGREGWMSGDNWLPARPVTALLLVGHAGVRGGRRAGGGVGAAAQSAQQAGVAFPLVAAQSTDAARSDAVFPYGRVSCSPLPGWVSRGATCGTASRCVCPTRVLPAFGVGMIIGCYVAAQAVPQAA